MPLTDDDLEAVKAAISERLSQKLEARGMTQVTLARKMDVSEATISRWISGAHVKQWAKLRLVCEAMGESADDVLGLSEQPRLSPEEASRVLEGITEALERLRAASRGLEMFVGQESEGD